MWLTLDAGNSGIKGGLFEERTVRRTFVLPFAVGSSRTNLAARLREELGNTKISRVGYCSVIPEASEIMKAALSSDGAPPVFEVSTRAALPFGLAYQTPGTLGADRIAAAAGGWLHHARPAKKTSLIVVDAGTAITVDAVTQREGYLGGAIIPGPTLLAQSLRGGTAQLPELAIEEWTAPIGLSTYESIQAGIYFSLVDGVRGIIHRQAEALSELNGRPIVVATGGWAKRLSTQVDEIDRVDRHLVLRGVRELMALNTPHGE